MLRGEVQSANCQNTPLLGSCGVNWLAGMSDNPEAGIASGHPLRFALVAQLVMCCQKARSPATAGEADSMSTRSLTGRMVVRVHPGAPNINPREREGCKSQAMNPARSAGTEAGGGNGINSMRSGTVPHNETTSPETLEHLKRCAYRSVWPRRNKLTPSAERRRGKNGTTWGRWFESRYCKPGESIEAYHAAQQARATAEQRVAREKALRARAGILESLEG